MEKKSIDIIKKIQEISNIPTLPIVLEKITRLLQNPQTSADEIGKAITTDQSLASKVLKLVNSAFYGFPGGISTITHAIVILGFATVKNLVLTASIFDVFKRDANSNPDFDMEKFWQHSIACGSAAKSLAKFVGGIEIEQCFIAGLIHDLGKIILCQYMPKEFLDAVRLTRKKNQLLYESEKELFSSTHQDIGGILTKNWNLPLTLQNAVCYHHQPENAQKHYMLTAIVHTADILVRAMDLGNGGDKKIPSISQHAWESLGLNHVSLQPILEAINDEYQKATIFMQI